MLNVIIDPYIHCPYLYYTLDKCEYTSPIVNNTPRYYSKESFKNKYDFCYTTNIDYEKKYDICFIVFPLLDIDPRHEPTRHRSTFPFLKKLTQSIRADKIIIFDNHDYAYVPEKKLLEDLKFNFILKRNFHCNFSYDNRIKPFHFLDCCGKIDSIFLLINRQKYKNITEEKNNKIWFSGSIYNHNDNIFNCYTSRKKIYKFIKKSKKIRFVSNMQHAEYLKNIGNYKYALSLMGCSSWGTRHFEILVQDTVLFSQRCDTTPDPKNHVFPFEEGDSFSEFNFFDSYEDLIKKYDILENDLEKYREVLKNQKLVIEKYYNYTNIKNYIFKLIS